jgi:hypothetical protein
MDPFNLLVPLRRLQQLTIVVPASKRLLRSTALHCIAVSAISAISAVSAVSALSGYCF